MNSSDPFSVKHLYELKVFRGNLFAGTLKRSTQGCEFSFSQSFLENEQYSELTYRIEKRTRPYIYQGVNLPPYFAGLLPEGLRLKTLVRELKTSEDDLFTLLAASGERAVGDVYTLAESLDRPEPQIPDVRQVDFYHLFEENIKSGLMAKSDDALAGVQEKLSASMISFPIHTAKKNKSYILKLNPKDKPNLTHNEYQCLKLAAKCGLEVNKGKLVFDKNNNPGLLVERFDRTTNHNNELLMVHQEDACQFLNRYPADKYRLSFSEICEGIKELSTAPLIELLTALQLYAFSYVIGNGDLHGKNMSLQTDFNTGRVQLTPSYDLICTYLYKDQSMALKLDGRDKNFKRANFIDFGKRFGLAEKAVVNMLDKLLSRIEKHQSLLLQIPNLTVKEEKLLEAMLATRLSDLS